jgi:hypothetical protein
VTAALGRTDVAEPRRECLAWNQRNPRIMDAIGRLAVVSGWRPVVRWLQRHATRCRWAGIAP